MSKPTFITLKLSKFISFAFFIEPQQENFSAKTDTSLCSVEEMRAFFTNKNYKIYWAKERDAKLTYSIAMCIDSMVAFGYKPNGYRGFN